MVRRVTPQPLLARRLLITPSLSEGRRGRPACRGGEESLPRPPSGPRPPLGRSRRPPSPSARPSPASTPPKQPTFQRRRSNLARTSAPSTTPMNHRLPSEPPPQPGQPSLRRPALRAAKSTRGCAADETRRAPLRTELGPLGVQRPFVEAAQCEGSRTRPTRRARAAWVRQRVIGCGAGRPAGGGPEGGTGGTLFARGSQWPRDRASRKESIGWAVGVC